MIDYAAIEAELKTFEAEERKKLGLEEETVEHWRDKNPQEFTKAQRATTTILLGGLTLAHDVLVTGAMAGLGYKIQALDCPDYDALRIGKEFGNRGQCNPTYFTVGNLVKHLLKLREGGMSTQDIIKNYVFLTAGSCGPCRFGTYVTEYRKALVDAGFDGFRVMLFQQQGGLKQATGEGVGLEMTPAFFKGLLKAILVGDVLNAAGYRIRPYEIEKGSTDQAMAECREILRTALEKQTSILRALWTCRKILKAVKVDRLKPKPKVTIIGEFWAMTTEGDGNYRLQRFLEQEGAEVEVQMVTAWLLYNIWEHRHDTKKRMELKSDDPGIMGLQGKNGRQKLALLWVAEKVLRGTFALYARTMGLGKLPLPDMDEIATISHQYYDNHLRGGEGHMEVGKLIQSVEHKKAHLVVSVKPFGCMPSSGVSDGVQSLVTAKHPEALFCAIETTGDGEVNVQSRVQMDLFKARQRAEKEYQEAVAKSGLSEDVLRKKAAKRDALHYPKHILAGTAANQVLELAR